MESAARKTDATPPPAAVDLKRHLLIRISLFALGIGLVASLMPRPPRSLAPRRQSANAKGARSAARQIWVLRDGQPVAVPVTVGSSDGRMTEVTGEGLEPGLPVITASLGAKQ